MSPVTETSRYLAEKLPAIEEALATLVDVNSFTENVEGGNQVAKLLSELFTIPGVRSWSEPSSRFAQHLVFETSPKGAGASLPPIALVGHLDTVFPPGFFEGYRRDGDLIRGPGVLDMKGGLVVVAFALKALAETVGFDELPPIRVVVVADEEVGSPEGALVIRKAIAGSSACLVFEAGRKGDSIITRRKGIGGMDVTVKGKAAHAGANHQDGANALWALAKFVDAAQGLTDYTRGITLNVGQIRGGHTKNTVPDDAWAELDFRYETAADGDWVLQRLREAASAAEKAVPGTSIRLEGGIVRPPLEKTPASEKLRHSYGEAARLFGLGHDEAVLIGGGSDASTASTMGIASIDGLGPRGLGFHTKDEQIERGSLIPKAQALAHFLGQWRRG